MTRRSVSRYYDWYGQPLTVSEIGDAARGHNFQVAVTDVPDAQVSTVFLHGIDHQHEDGPPLLFESLVFGGVLNHEMARYSTEAEARTGHAAMVERVKAAEARFEAFTTAPEVAAAVAVIESVRASMELGEWDREQFYGLIFERVSRAAAVSS